MEGGPCSPRGTNPEFCDVIELVALLSYRAPQPLPIGGAHYLTALIIRPTDLTYILSI
jgi:hypothetical protein